MKHLLILWALMPALLFADGPSLRSLSANDIDLPKIEFGKARQQPKAITDAPAFSWAGAAVYDFNTHRFNGIILNNTFPLHTPSGHATGFSLGLFGGVAGNAQANALAGGGLMFSKVIFQEVSGWLLFGGDVQGGSGTAFHAVAGGGIAIRF